MKRLLIVDGSESTVEEEKRILAGRGLEIFTAKSAEEALTVHQKEKVDLIIAGLDLRGMGGDELCSFIRNDDSIRKVSFIIVCKGRKAELERCTQCGANAYITKPFDPVIFLEKVSTLVDIPKRSAVRVLMKVTVKGNHGNIEFFCNSINISTSGILIETDKALSRGDIIACSFFVPGSQNITVDCEVVRIINMSPDARRYGVKFLNLSESHRLSIDEFVRRKCR